MYEKPEYSMSFDDPDVSAIKGTEARANELTKQVLRAANPAPVIDEAPDTFVLLPAGVIVEKEVIQEAEVQELTGEHEEKLAKAKASGNPAKYVNTLLQCGVVMVGHQKATPKLLGSMLQGDLDALLMGIRRATFGDEFEVFGVACPHCQEFNDLTLNLSDIPINGLEDPEEREFLVKLRKDRTARIRFPTGDVQDEIFRGDITSANLVTLAYSVISIIEADGTENMSTGLASVKKLGIADINTLQNYIYENQPGPRYDQVVANCHSCEGEVPVPLSVGILFREL